MSRGQAIEKVSAEYNEYNKMRHIESDFEQETKKILRSREGDLDSGGDNK